MLKNRNTIRWTMLIAANIVGACVLGFLQNGSAAQKGAPEPFANAVEQRAEMVEQLKQLNALIKEQNALLRDGTLKVVVTTEKK